MTDSNNTLIALPRAEDRTAQWQLVHTGNIRRCVRGIPVEKEIISATDRPANDNSRGGRYPLQEEYKARRLGIESEGDVLWATSKWFAGHYDLANRSPDACSYGLSRKVDAGELGGFVDAEESEEARGSTDPLGYQIENNLLRAIAPVDPH